MQNVFRNMVGVLCILAVLCLWGCESKPAVQTGVPEGTTEAETTAPVETVTPAETTVPTETTTPAETAAPTESTEAAQMLPPDAEVPYLQKVPLADQSVYSGPGYDYSFVSTVREAGTYTILEEARDEEGNLWGRLKSGIGWIDLTEVRARIENPPPISANYADENLLLHGAYHLCPGDALEYRIPIVFRAYGTLQDVALFTFEFSGEDYGMGADFFTLPELTPEMPLVAELAFPGDMSMYGIRFVDEAGVSHLYSIYISGRNGALVLGEYEP